MRRACGRYRSSGLHADNVSDDFVDLTRCYEELGISGCEMGTPLASVPARDPFGYRADKVRNGGASGWRLASLSPMEWQLLQFDSARSRPRSTSDPPNAEDGANVKVRRRYFTNDMFHTARMLEQVFVPRILGDRHLRKGETSLDSSPTLTATARYGEDLRDWAHSPRTYSHFCRVSPIASRFGRRHRLARHSRSRNVPALCVQDRIMYRRELRAAGRRYCLKTSNNSFLKRL